MYKIAFIDKAAKKLKLGFMKRKFLRNIIWNFIGNIFYLGIQWVITVFVARKSGLRDAGVLSLAMSVSAIFQTIAFWGMRNYQVSDIEEKYTDNTYIKSRIDTCILSLVFCMGFALISSYDFRQMMAILCFMCFRISEGFSDVLHGICQKNGRLDLAGKGFFMKGIAIAIMFSIGYCLFDSLNIGLFLMAIGASCVTLFYDYRNSLRFAYSLDRIEMLSDITLLRETLPLCICVFLQSAISTVPKLILEKTFGEVALGAYSSVFAPALLIQAAAGYIFIPFIGYFSACYQRRNVRNFKKLFLKICLCIAAIGAIVILCAKLIGWRILSFVFGSVIVGYEYLLIPVLLCAIANAFFAFVCMLSVVVRDFRGQIIACSLGLLVCIVSTIICIRLFGVNGTSYGILIGGGFSCLFLVKRLARKLEFNSSE